MASHTLQPVAYGPRETPAWASGSHTDLLGLDRPTLAWFTRWRDADEGSRLVLARSALNRRQIDALSRLEANLIELGLPLGWFEPTTGTQPWKLRKGILDRLLAGLGARPECVPDLVRACRLPETATHHQQALTEALTAHLRPAEEPTARPASRDQKAAHDAAPIPNTNNDEKGTHMATMEQRRRARADLIEMHEAGEVDLREALPKGLTERLQHSTGIEQKAWKEAALNLSTRADKLPAFGSKPRDPNAHLVGASNGASGSNGHHSPEPEAPGPYDAERAKYTTKTAHINALAAARGLLAPGVSLPSDTLLELAKIVGTTPGSVQAVIYDLRKKLTQPTKDAATANRQNGHNGHTPAAKVAGVPQETAEAITSWTDVLEMGREIAAAQTESPTIPVQQQVEQAVTFLAEREAEVLAADAQAVTPNTRTDIKEVRIGECGHPWFIAEGDECPRCQLIQERDAVLVGAEVNTQAAERLETFVNRLARQLGVEQGDQIEARVGILAGKANAHDEAVVARNNALKQIQAQQRLFEAINEAIGGHVFDDTTPEELPELVQQKVGNLQRDADALRGPAAAMGELCALLNEPDPMKAATRAGDCVAEVKDAHELLDRLGIDINGEDDEPATLRDRIAWLADRIQPETALAPAEVPGLQQPLRLQVELLRPELGYELTPEDRQAALAAAAGVPVDVSLDLHQRLARTVLVSDILGVALR